MTRFREPDLTTSATTTSAFRSRAPRSRPSAARPSLAVKTSSCSDWSRRCSSSTAKKLCEIIERQFGRKTKRAAQCHARFRCWVRLSGRRYSQNGTILQGRPRTTTDRVTTDGNTALTYGLLAGGVRYGAGYPITPWSPIMERCGSSCRSTADSSCKCEDELAAVSAHWILLCGHLAMTGSSGPVFL